MTTNTGRISVDSYPKCVFEDNKTKQYSRMDDAFLSCIVLVSLMVFLHVVIKTSCCLQM